MEFYEKTMKRILPLHPAAVNLNMDKEKLRTEAEIWCKPFACAISGCSEPRPRNDEEKARCLQAPMYLKKCVSTVLDHMDEILDKKRKESCN